MLLTLNSELPLLLVASGESNTLAVRRFCPDLTLYIEDAGMFVIRGRRLPGTVRLISICLIAISKDFFDSELPKPKLSGEEDLPDKLLWGECRSSCLGGTSFLIFITLSTIFVPTRIGLTLSFAFACNLFTAGTGTELPLLCIMPLGGRPLAGEHDCRLILPFETGSIDDERELGAPGLPRDAEGGLSGSVVLKFGGASRENPGISEGFHGLGFTDGELDRAGTGFFTAAETGLATEEELGDFIETEGVLIPLDTDVGLLVGVEDLDVDLEGGAEDLLVGVEDLAVDRDVGVEDLGGAEGFDEETVERVGVEDLEGFETKVGVALDVKCDVGLAAAADEGLLEDEVNVPLDELKVGRPVGVAGLDPGPPEEDGLRSPPLEVFNP